MENNVTASIIIIGNEILNGQTRDTNSNFLCRHLHECGIKIKKISVIPDDINVIAEEVSYLSKRNTHVLTSGGVGPTHDDVTYAGIAKAFGEELFQNDELVSVYCQLGLIEKFAVQLSVIPKSSQIHYTKTSENKSFIPLISVKNVFAFPGIPSYLESMFLYLKQHFLCDMPFYHRYIYCVTSEFCIIDALRKAVHEFSPEVSFGSYPDIEKPIYKVKLSLECKNEDLLDKAEGYLRSILPDHITTSSLNVKSKLAADELYNMVQNNSIHDKMFLSVLKESIDSIESCLKKYGPNKICLSFNGGKDCTVLLHLISCIFIKNHIETKLKILYVYSTETFPEVDAFLKLCIERYDLELIQYDFPIIDALKKLKESHPLIESILIGTRNTDPHGKEMKIFQMTDSKWPQFMRVNPLLHWSYNNVWQFLRLLHIPYCCLYDKGYTSLGCKTSTLPNPKLKMTTKNDVVFYGPAFLLKNHEEERNGRK